MFPQYSAWSNWGLVDLTTAATVADYQVKLILDIEPEMNISGSDVLDFRACTLSGESLNYWVESVGTSTFTVWVKVPLGTQQVVYYWGNSQAVSESDGEKVFEWFDGFKDTSKWGSGIPQVAGQTGTFSVSDGIGTFAANTSNYSGYSWPTASPVTLANTIVTLKANSITFNSSSQFRLVAANNTSADPGTNNGLFISDNGVKINYTVNSTTSYYSSQASWFSSARDFEWSLVANGVMKYDGNQIISLANTAPTLTGLYLRLFVYKNTSATVDYIHVRKYQTTEPIINTVYKFRNSPLYVPVTESGTTTLEISSTTGLTCSSAAGTLLNKYLSSEVSKTGSSTASINLAKYISSNAESACSETANILLQKLISSSTDLAGSSTANISLQKFISSITNLSGSSTAAIYLQTSDLSILAEMVVSATASISVSKSISSTADVAGNSTAKATVFKYVSSESASQIGSLVNAILTKYITSETGLSGSATVNITRYNYISSLGLIEISATATVGGGTAISLDFVYPLTVYIFLKQRTVTIQKNVRTVTFK